MGYKYSIEYDSGGNATITKIRTWENGEKGREYNRLRAERKRREAGVLPRGSTPPCSCLPCQAERLYTALKRAGDPLAYAKSHAVGKDYDSTCPCHRCQKRVSYYRMKYLTRIKTPTTIARVIVATTKKTKDAPKEIRPPKLDRLDLIALRDPIISQGRPNHETQP